MLLACWVFTLVASPQRIAVPGLEGPNVAPAIISAVEETVAAEAALSSGLDVTSPSSIRSYLGMQEKQQILGCNGATCMNEASRLLQADLMIAGTILSDAGQLTLVLSLVDLKKNTTLKRGNMALPEDPTDRSRAVRALTASLFGIIGKIAIWNQPTEAEVYLDGRFMGATPVSALTVDSPGKHEVAITGPGVTPWRSSVVIETGETERLRAMNIGFAELEQRSTLRRVAAAGALVASAGAAAASVALWALAVGNDQQLDRLDLRAATQPELNAITGRTVGLTVGASITTALTAGLAALGIALWLDNPWQRMLEQQP